MGYTLVNHNDPSVESYRGAFFKTFVVVAAKPLPAYDGRPSL